MMAREASESSRVVPQGVAAPLTRAAIFLVAALSPGPDPSTFRVPRLWPLLLAVRRRHGWNRLSTGRGLPLRCRRLQQTLREHIRNHCVAR